MVDAVSLSLSVDENYIQNIMGKLTLAKEATFLETFEHFERGRRLFSLAQNVISV